MGKLSKLTIIQYLLIIIGSVLYSLATVIFIFPHELLLGGTSGFSVILHSFIDFSPGTILVVINFTLTVLAFVFLGRDMALKTVVGSLLTAAFIGWFEALFAGAEPLVDNLLLSSLIGSSIIAIASGIMFYVDSSSGGTDIIALIIKKYFNLKIGTALLLTDILIVIVGGLLSNMTMMLCSFLAFIIKTVGINVIIYFITAIRK